MKLKDLYEHLDRRPFKPFTVELFNGRRVRVEDPDLVQIGCGREKPAVFLVYTPDRTDYTMFWPDSIGDLQSDGESDRSADEPLAG